MRPQEAHHLAGELDKQTATGQSAMDVAEVSPGCRGSPEQEVEVGWREGSVNLELKVIQAGIGRIQGRCETYKGVTCTRQGGLRDHGWVWRVGSEGSDGERSHWTDRREPGPAVLHSK